MANQITRDIYVLRKSIIEPIHYVRLTNAVDIVFNMRDYDIPSGAVAAVYAQKPDGTAVYSNATISENTVTVEMTTQMVAVLGVGHLQVRIQSGSNSSDVLCSFVVPLIVEPNFTEGDFPPSQNENGFFGDVEEHLKQVESDMTTMKEEWTEFQSDITQQVQEIQEEQTTQGSEITDLQKKVAKLDEEKSPALVLDASGSWVTVDDSGDSAANGLTIHGKSTQVVTTGKNLFDINNEDQYYSEVLVSHTDTKIVKNNKLTPLLKIENLEVGTNYTISYHTVLANAILQSRLLYSLSTQYAAYPTGNFLNRVGNGTTTYDNIITFEAPAETIYFIGSIESETITQFQIEKGATATAYEPYTGGAPSPSPDYPQEITSVGDSGGVEVVSTGENLYTGGDLYNVTGTESKTFLTLGTEMMLDAICDNVSGSVNVYMNAIYYDKDSNMLGANGIAEKIEGENIPYNFKMTGRNASNGGHVDMSNVRKVELVVRNYSGYDGVFNVRNIMIQPLIPDKPLNNFSGYEQQPSTATFSTPNGLPGIPVDSGGNYTDEDGQQWICDEIDTKAGVYRQRVGKVQYIGDASEKWIDYSSEKYKGFNINLAGRKIAAFNHGLCNRFPVDMNTNSTEPGIWIGSTSTSDVSDTIYFHNCNPSIASSLEEWRTWLSTHPVTLIYPLATPVETPLSDAELISAGDFRTFATVTNVTTEDPVEPEITLEYAADLKTYIDKKLAEISAATLENATNASQ